MDIRQLRYFVEVVEAKSFTKAADRVHVAQPALGFQVRKLEDEIGTELLVRHSRGVEPTEAGQVLLRHAHAILRQIDRAKQELIDLSGPPRGDVALGITPTTSALLATRLVTNVRRDFPGVSLNIVEGLSEQLMRWLAANRIDMAFTYNPDAVSGLRTVPLLTEDLYFIGPIDRRGKFKKTTKLEKVVGYPLIVPSPPHGARVIIEEAAAEAGVELDVSLQIDSVATTRELVEDGVGFTILPLAAVRQSVEAGHLFACRIVEPRVSRTLHLAFSANYLESAASRALQEVVERVVAECIDQEEGYARPNR